MNKGALNHIKPIEKFALFLAIVLLSFVFTSFLGAFLAHNLFGSEIEQEGILNDWSRQDVLRILKILQALSHFGLFIIPVFVFNKLVGLNNQHYLNFKSISSKMVMALPIIFIALLFLNGLLYELNRSIDFTFISPDFSYNLEYNQALSDKKIDAFVGATWLSFWVNLIVICVLPAIGEELAFRGVLQRIFIEWTGAPHIGIFIAALVFCIIHWQPLNALPIMALGLVFGYIVFLTGSIWVTIILHFLNNAFRLIMMHLEDVIDSSAFYLNEWYVVLFIGICVLLLVKIFKLKTIKAVWNHNSQELQSNE